jgi:hypothetical protein
MGRVIDYNEAREVLTKEYERAEVLFGDGQTVAVPDEVAQAIARVFQSNTESHKEVLIGLAIARILDPEIDLHLPYVKLGENAFNARELDQRVINPFLRNHAVPCTTGPYLNTFRRSVIFNEATAKGVRDTESYTGILSFITALEDANADTARSYLRYLMIGFVNLREAANILLVDVRRISLDQYSAIIDGLLPLQTGGWLPVLLAVATLQTLTECFGLGWRIEWQGINVADRARGEAGDISVYHGDEPKFSIEVTEREVDRNRVTYVFDTKIAPNGLDDYLFFYTATEPTAEAREAARRYFAQGHDVNLISIRDWIITTLTTIGPQCRRMFTEQFRELLNTQGVPAALKHAWNEQLRGLVN